MGLSEGDFERAMPNVSDELRQTMQRAYEALQEKWRHESIAAETSYLIDIPAQSLCIVGEENAQQVLRMLRSVRVRGTYRIKKGGSNEGNRT